MSAFYFQLKQFYFDQLYLQMRIIYYVYNNNKLNKLMILQ